MMLVQHILQDAQRRLAVLGREASVREVAKILTNTSIPIVVVCDADGVAMGLVSRTDVIRAITRANNDALSINAEQIMTTSMQSTHVDQTLQSLWTMLGAGGLRCAPVLDSGRKPLGVVHARDLARALLEEDENEESSLRDYVLGIGY